MRELFLRRSSSTLGASKACVGGQIEYFDYHRPTDLIEDVDSIQSIVALFAPS